MMDVRFVQETVAVGEALTGTLIWQSSDTKVPKKATLSIGWRTEGRGTRDRQTVVELPLDPNQLANSQGLAIPFSLTVPYEGPITYNGTLIRVIWELQVVIDRPGFLAPDEKQTWPFQVSPRHL